MLNFDSQEEKEVYNWIMELYERGIITSFTHQPESFQLSHKRRVPIKKVMKTKTVDSDFHLMNGHLYTADFLIHWNSEYLNKMFYELNMNQVLPAINYKEMLIACENDDFTGFCSYIEVKPIFDQNNMTRLFKINQKWVLDKYGIFVNMIIPDKLFEMTFTPGKRLVLEKTGKPRKVNYKNVININEYLSKLELCKITEEQVKLF